MLNFHQSNITRNTGFVLCKMYIFKPFFISILVVWLSAFSQRCLTPVLLTQCLLGSLALSES